MIIKNFLLRNIEKNYMKIQPKSNYFSFLIMIILNIKEKRKKEKNYQKRKVNGQY